jgi:hypothetical protein
MGLFDNSVALDLSPISCCTCGMTFGAPAAWEQARRAKHDGFFCPNGHPLVFNAKSDAEKLRDQLAAEKHRREQAEARVEDVRQQRDAAERQVSARKGVATRLKRKIAAGRCPCCSHEFKDLKRHMKVEHPKWDPEKHAAAVEAKESTP